MISITRPFSDTTYNWVMRSLFSYSFERTNVNEELFAKTLPTAFWPRTAYQVGTICGAFDLRFAFRLKTALDPPSNNCPASTHP